MQFAQCFCYIHARPLQAMCNLHLTTCSEYTTRYSIEELHFVNLTSTLTFAQIFILENQNHNHDEYTRLKRQQFELLVKGSIQRYGTSIFIKMRRRLITQIHHHLCECTYNIPQTTFASNPKHCRDYRLPQIELDIIKAYPAERRPLSRSEPYSKIPRGSKKHFAFVKKSPF